MAGPQNGIMGDESLGFDLPETQVAMADLQEAERAARFSRSREFKRLKEHLEQRIEFYQKTLPDGRPLTAVDSLERGQQWVIANAVIGELKSVLGFYQDAQESVNARRKRT